MLESACPKYLFPSTVTKKYLFNSFLNVEFDKRCRNIYIDGTLYSIINLCDSNWRKEKCRPLFLKGVGNSVALKKKHIGNIASKIIGNTQFSKLA